jgi:diadenosine tetraphosphate (Ap4A) HIT family hydrolase
MHADPKGKRTKKGMSDAELGFHLHERLAEDTDAVVEWKLSTVRLMNDRTWPWLILVPRRANVRELHELETLEVAMLVAELKRASGVIADICKPDKVNIGMLGNLVPQLHIHVIGRFRDDPAWPGPVWSFRPPVPYREQEKADVLERLRKALN